MINYLPDSFIPRGNVYLTEGAGVPESNGVTDCYREIRPELFSGGSFRVDGSNEGRPDARPGDESFAMLFAF